MTAVSDMARPHVARVSSVETQPVSLGKAITAESIKFRTLRSTVAVLGATVLGIVLIGLLIGYNTRHLTANLQPDDHVQSSTLQGYYLGQLLIGALGVLFVTGEYSTGMIRSTLAAIPKRVPVLWAKLIVMATVTLAAMVPTCLVTFVAAQAVISESRAGYSLGDPGVLRVVFGTAVYLTIIGLIGAMLGWIIRSTPGALVAFVALFLVVPILFGSVLGTFGKHVAQYLPSNAGASFANTIREQPSLGPWMGLGVLAVWLAASIVVAIWTITHRDA